MMFGFCVEYLFEKVIFRIFRFRKFLIVDELCRLRGENFKIEIVFLLFCL